MIAGLKSAQNFDDWFNNLTQYFPLYKTHG